MLIGSSKQPAHRPGSYAGCLSWVQLLASGVLLKLHTHPIHIPYTHIPYIHATQIDIHTPQHTHTKIQHTYHNTLHIHTPYIHTTQIDMHKHIHYIDIPHTHAPHTAHIHTPYTHHTVPVVSFYSPFSLSLPKQYSISTICIAFTLY